MYIYIYIYTYIYIYAQIYIYICHLWGGESSCGEIAGYDDDNNGDVYLRLQHGKGFHNLVCMSYVKHIKPSQ
jgi:hypothetical protein